MRTKETEKVPVAEEPLEEEPLGRFWGDILVV
jgi:hypothetical protein